MAKKVKNTYLAVIMTVLVALSLASSGKLNAQSKEEKVTLRIPWKMGGDYAPFPLGVEKGFYGHLVLTPNTSKCGSSVTT